MQRDMPFFTKQRRKLSVETVRPSVLATVTFRLTLQGSSDFHETHSCWTFHVVQNKKTCSPNSAPPCLVLNFLWTQRYLYRQWLWLVWPQDRPRHWGMRGPIRAGNWYSVEMTNEIPVLWDVIAVCLSGGTRLTLDYTKTQLGWGESPRLHRVFCHKMWQAVQGVLGACGQKDGL